MRPLASGVRLFGAGVVLAVAAGATGLWAVTSTGAESEAPAQAVEMAMPVSVAVVERREVAAWDEFSGRLEAVERVEVRPRVAGAVHAVHFREGALVERGDLLVTIDPEPYAAEVARAEAHLAGAQARLGLTQSELDRGRQLWDSRTVSERELETRLNAHREAEAALRAAEASLQAARLNLGYTEVRAPITGRVGRLQVTVGNLVAAGPEAPVLTTLVSVDPIYASFSAGEEVVMRALKALGSGEDPHLQVERIPVELTTVTHEAPLRGRLQLIDNQFDAGSGTVRLRAAFDNPDGLLIPGQFARIRLGRAEPEPALLVSERAVGTDQDKKFVMVVDGESRAAYREVTLGATVEGLRVVTGGLAPGERVIVNGLQRVRPGGRVAPEAVPMDVRAAAQTQASAASSDPIPR